MGRHADTSSPARRTVAPRLLVAASVVLLAVVGVGVWLVAGSYGSGATASGCPRTTSVRVTVAPELAPTVGRLLAGAPRASDGSCVHAVVTSQTPLETVGSLAALAPDAIPQVWVPDSSLWLAQSAAAQPHAVGSAARSPVVLATSRAAADQRGWATTAPSWADAAKGTPPLALPDLTASAAQLSALGAVSASSGTGTDADADDATVQAVLASGRAGVSSTADALAGDRSDAPNAPVVPVAEQTVVATDRAAGGSPVSAVYPSGGTPVLDYPVVEVGRASAAPAPAVDVVVRTLTSPAAGTAVRAAGFRDPSGAPPTGAAAGLVPTTAPAPLALAPEQLGALLQKLTTLSKPTRLLTVVDVSSSMVATAGSGTRITLARDALESALSLLPDSYAGGVWDFAYTLQGDQDWQQLAPIAPFGSSAGGTTQRQLIHEQFDSLPTRLRPGGTALYDTTLAAVRASRAAFDPAAVNSVVLITDGRNEDDHGIPLDQLLSTLRSEADPSRPVKVVAIGIGPDADMGALQQIAATTGGASYQAVNPADLQNVLFDAIRRRAAS